MNIFQAAKLVFFVFPLFLVAMSFGIFVVLFLPALLIEYYNSFWFWALYPVNFTLVIWLCENSKNDKEQKDG